MFSTAADRDTGGHIIKRGPGHWRQSIYVPVTGVQEIPGHCGRRQFQEGGTFTVDIQ